MCVPSKSGSRNSEDVIRDIRQWEDRSDTLSLQICRFFHYSCFLCVWWKTSERFWQNCPVKQFILIISLLQLSWVCQRWTHNCKNSDIIVTTSILNMQQNDRTQGKQGPIKKKEKTLNSFIFSNILLSFCPWDWQYPFKFRRNINRGAFQVNKAINKLLWI